MISPFIRQMISPFIRTNDLSLFIWYGYEECGLIPVFINNIAGDDAQVLPGLLVRIRRGLQSHQERRSPLSAGARDKAQEQNCSADLARFIQRDEVGVRAVSSETGQNRPSSALIGSHYFEQLVGEAE